MVWGVLLCRGTAARRVEGGGPPALGREGERQRPRGVDREVRGRGAKRARHPHALKKNLLPRNAATPAPRKGQRERERGERGKEARA